MEAQGWGRPRSGGGLGDQDEEAEPEHKGLGCHVNMSRLRKAVGFVEKS